MNPIHEEVLLLLGQPVVRAGLVVGCSLVAAFLLRRIMGRLLGVLTRKTKTTLDETLLGHVKRPVFLSVILIGLAWAAQILGLGDLSRFVLFAVLQTIAVVVWSAAAFKISSILLAAIAGGATGSSVIQNATEPLFDMLLKVAIIAAALYFGFVAWDIDLTAWLASAGVLGIAVGFAAKDTLANFFSGIFIVADSPYKVGDYIVIDGDLRGQVTQIGLRSTRILTRDDVEITVPNALIANSQIINETGGPDVKQRIRLSVEAAYGSDIDQVREVLLSCAENLQGADSHPAPQVRFREFGGSGLRFELLVWIHDPGARGLVLDRMHSRVYKAFNAAGIEIPYSKHDVYIKGAVEPVGPS